MQISSQKRKRVCQLQSKTTQLGKHANMYHAMSTGPIGPNNNSGYIPPKKKQPKNEVAEEAVVLKVTETPAQEKPKADSGAVKSTDTSGQSGLGNENNSEKRRADQEEMLRDKGKKKKTSTSSEEKRKQAEAYEANETRNTKPDPDEDKPPSLDILA